MSEELDQAIEDAATTPQALAVEGESVTNRSVDDLLKLKKFEAAQTAVNGGYGGMANIRRKFPGASGLH